MDIPERKRGRPRKPAPPSTAVAERLRDISIDIARKQGQIRQLEQERNVLAHQAIAEGWSHSQIAALTGLTRGRIGQIAARPPQEG